MRPLVKYLCILIAFIASSEAEPDPSCNVRGTGSSQFLCNDERLGPANLPEELLHLLDNYSRLGGEDPVTFLSRWSSGGDWVYPGANGFLLDSTGAAMAKFLTLKVGTLVDRIGAENGMQIRFLPLADRNN